MPGPVWFSLDLASVSSELPRLVFGIFLACFQDTRACDLFSVVSCSRFEANDRFRERGGGEIVIAYWRGSALDRRCLYPTLVPKLL
jgi:hypothetical protein